MPTAYDPKAIEAGWYARWEAARLFTADPNSGKPKYTIAVPPPNITGELHMGHATNGTLQDVWCRYKRMSGFEVLWLPGTDHAAIATQNVIEKNLAREGTTKEEIGRAAFEEIVEEWYRSVGATIISQFRMLGASLDWTRTRFTMDPPYVRAVRTAFVRYYEQGWMYRGPRIVNWCPRCQSAISDLEVEWREHHDTLYYVRYEIEGGGSITIATVRPETMLADTGVAVHPDDARYRAVVGRTAILPVVGRKLRIVADAGVDKDFATGALKITPGHDALDYEIGERHGLELVNAMHPDGTMDTPFAPQFDGLRGDAARELMVDLLRQRGHLERTEEYVHQVGHCDRCGTVLEPLVSTQWFLRMDELAKMCVEASERGAVRWHPERYERTYLDWVRGIRDWCVSRQLWLGHRIPVYTCGNGHQVAAVDPPAACPDCGSSELTEDPDVLDTWFSSALWPFATLGWPDETPEIEAFYPTDLNSTARDIINLWVTRMIFSGLYFTGRAPFSDVQVHATIQAADGRRMSKSLGTGVDPRDVIAEYGADALRAWAAQVGMSSQDVRFDKTRIEGFKRFGNKLWNATRLVLSGLGEDFVRVDVQPDADLALEDRWILSRLQATIKEATEGIEAYSFQRSVDAIYDFAWHEFCDWYLEAAKPRLRDADQRARATAVTVLDALFRLLHPFMPFLSEDLWQRLPRARDDGYLMQQPWPVSDPRFGDGVAEDRFATLMALVEETRAVRHAARAGDRGGRLRALELEPAERELVGAVAAVEMVEAVAADALPLTWGDAALELPARDASRVVTELARLEADLERVEAKLANAAFRERAPAAVVDKEVTKAEELRSAIGRLRAGLA